MGMRLMAAALIASAAFATGAGAQVPSDSLALTLDEAVARAVESSEEVRTAQAQRELAESQVVQTRAGALPQVNASVAYNRTLASIFDDFSFGPPPGEGGGQGEEGPVLPFGRPNTWAAGLTVTQPVYAAGRISTGLEIAENVRSAADMEVSEAEAEIALQVKSAYFQAVLASDLVGISEEAYALANEQLEQVELFRRQGTVSDFEVLRARVERDNLEPAIVDARNARRLAELNLKRLVNIPAEQPVRLLTPLEPVVVEVDATALRAALAGRPALAALEQVVAAREGAVKIARSNRLPTIGAVANLSYQAFPTGVTPVDANWMRDWSVGLQVSIPLFDGLRTRGAIRQANAELTQATLQRDQAREGLEVELESALGEFESARTQIEARRSTVEQARQALELAELRFASGLATQLEISNARLLFEQARVNEAQALYAYLNAIARLERVSGTEILPGG